MPAHRSRTEHWRDCLKQIHERGGALEISVDRGQGLGAQEGSDIVWRCKLLTLTDSTMVVEPPAAFGATISLKPGVSLVGGITIGQNRWMFHTRTLGYAGNAPQNAGASVMDRPLVLEMPTAVERCTRRSFYRISTANLQLPGVQCWPLLDPGSVGAAEAANRAQLNDLRRSAGVAGSGNAGPGNDAEGLLLPDVGPMFSASLLNLSGGGLGLLMPHSESAALGSRPFVWMRLDLRPQLAAPIAVTARVAHTHIDSGQNLYAGMAFDFSHNPSHRAFVIEVISQYVETLQRRQQGGQARAA